MFSNFWLQPATALYRLGMQRRRTRCLGRQAGERTPCPVISIGNISVGGTGKTPLVDWVATLLKNRGYKVAVVGRGYGGAFSQQGAVVSDGETVFLDAREAGDEALLHARHLPGVAVVIGRDRHEAIQRAVERCGANVVLLDDGFQYWSVPRQLDMVLLSTLAPWTNGHLLPRGRLREEPAALSRAGAVILTRANLVPESALEALRQQVGKYTAAPIFEAEHVAVDLWDETKQCSIGLAFLQGKSVAAIAAIADPEGFSLLLESLGAKVETCLFKKDHHAWSAADFADLQKLMKTELGQCRARGLDEEIAVCTEKDAVKLDPSWLNVPLYSLRIRFGLRGQEAELENLILSKLKGYPGP